MEFRIQMMMALLAEFGFDLVEKEGLIMGEREDEAQRLSVHVRITEAAATFGLMGQGWEISGLLGDGRELRRILENHAPKRLLAMAQEVARA